MDTRSTNCFGALNATANVSRVLPQSSPELEGEGKAGGEGLASEVVREMEEQCELIAQIEDMRDETEKLVKILSNVAVSSTGSSARTPYVCG